MFTRHVSRELAAYIDGELSLQEAARVELHAAQCAACREERERVEFGMEALGRLLVVEPPEAVWISIEAALREHVHVSESPSLRERLWRRLLARGWTRRPIDNRPQVANLPHKAVREHGARNPAERVHTSVNAARIRACATAAAILAVVGLVYWVGAHRTRTQWDVVRLGGSPVVNKTHIGGEGRIAAGEWIETDSLSTARVKVGAIGSVEIEPNTRLRVVTARPGEHRLALARGEIRARISAPPKLFFVDTASGTAVDLGCEYTLDADEAGSGLLRVTKGWVSFQWKGLESLVPAGASCRLQPRVGPGIPYFDDAPESLKQALERSDLDAILADARVRDTLTLWHLLQRVEAADRARVYDRIASLTPVPAGVSREQALRLDPETLRLWKEELAWTW